jgi:hypothetical protein
VRANIRLCHPAHTAESSRTRSPGTESGILPVPGKEANLKLGLEALADLDRALARSGGVTEVRFGVKVVRDIGVEGLIGAAGRFPDIERIRVSDDYLRTEEVRTAFEEAVRTTYPDLSFAWTYDLLIDGRHGR